MKSDANEQRRKDPTDQSLLKMLSQALAGGPQKPLLNVLAETSQRMQDDVRSVMAEMREHIAKIRRSAPPLRIKVAATKSARWLQEPEASQRIAALTEAGLSKLGLFRVEGVANLSGVIFGDLNRAWSAVVFRTGKSFVLDLAAHYPDGTVVECTDAPDRPGRPNPPWLQRQHHPGLAPAALVEIFRQALPQAAPQPVSREQVFHWMEDSFARVQAWHAERGGWDRTEMPAPAGPVEEADAREQLECAWHDNTERWMWNWLRLQKELPFALEETAGSLVLVTEQFTPEQLAHAWWMGSEDYGVREERFDGAVPLDVFAQVNAERGAPLRCVFQKTTAPRAAFYLAQPKTRRMRSTGPVADALEEGLARGDLRASLVKLGEARIQSREAAEAICEALSLLQVGQTPQFVRQVQTLVRLVQNVASRECDAFGVLSEKAQPHLIRLLRELRTLPGDEAAPTMLALARVLAMYGTHAGADEVIALARAGVGVELPAWSGIFSQFSQDHPETAHVLGSLAETPPGGLLGVALLDAANRLRLEGSTLPHPFDSDAGRQQLLFWLEGQDHERHSYAHSAAAAVPFVGEAGRDQLLAAARGHPDQEVRLEAAWAAAKVGRQDGWDQLVQHCLQRTTSRNARVYLEELGRPDLIPAEARDPAFQAMAELSSWLAHPNELGRHPDELTLVDQRLLPWPPERTPRPFWLMRYRAKPVGDEEEESVGCGLVGSVTFCLFSYELQNRPPEDAYAVHCYWEMEQEGLIEEEELEEDDKAGQKLLKQWKGAPLQEARVVAVARLQAELGAPSKEVGLATAQLEGRPVVIILDKARTTVRPAAAGEEDLLGLRIHVGRVLLGLPVAPPAGSP